MKKGIQDVRKNIAERKKQRFQRGPTNSKTRSYVLPQDEEMHGYPPIVHSSGKGKTPVEGTGTSYVGLQILLSVLLFATLAIGKNTNVSLFDGPEQWLTSQMQEDFPFAKVTSWYTERFGDPLQMVADAPADNLGEAADMALPVNGTVTTSFQNDGRGIIMSTENGEEVKAVKSGTVVFAGKDDNTDKTVIIQHEDGSKTIYGYLSDINVYLYENIKAQTTVGRVQSEEGQAAEFFFAIEKNEEYIDPVKVMKVDESS